MSLVNELDPEVTIRTGDSSTEFQRLRVQANSIDSTTWLSDWHGNFPADFETPAMQHPLQRSRYLNCKLVAVRSPAMLREVAILRTLGTSKHVQRLYDAFLDSRTGEVHLILEPLEGNAYQLSRSRRRRAFAPGLLVDMARQLAEGLKFVHSLGLVHRNLVTENVLVTTLGYATYTVSEGSRELDLAPDLDSPRDVVVQIKLSRFERACALEDVYGRELLEDGDNLCCYRSPELLHLDLGEGSSSCLNSSIDTWALGFILVDLTALCPPYLLKAASQTQLDEIMEKLGPTHLDTVNYISVLAAAVRLDCSALATWIECLVNLLQFDPRLRSSAEDVLRLPLVRSGYSTNYLHGEQPRAMQISSQFGQLGHW